MSSNKKSSAAEMLKYAERVYLLSARGQLSRLDLARLGQVKRYMEMAAENMRKHLGIPANATQEEAAEILREKQGTSDTDEATEVRDKD